MMERFKLKNGVLLPPPRNAVASDGHVISNFNLMVARDADFAAENGYYPKAATQPECPEGSFEATYRLSDGAWQTVLVPIREQEQIGGEM